MTINLRIKHYIVILGVIASIIVTSCFTVYADDLDQDLSWSSSSATLVDEDVFNEKLIDYDNKYGLDLKATSARTIDDVYNILASSMLPRLVEIRNNLQTTTGSQSVADVAKLIKDVLYSGSSAPASDGTVWALINKMYQAVLSGTITINGTDVPSVFGNIPLINAKLSGSSGTIYEVEASSNTLLGSLLTNIASMNNKTKDYTSAFSTNNSYLNTIRSYTASTNSFLKNFTFTSVPQTTRQYSLDNVTYQSIDNASGNFDSDVYFTVDSTLNSNDSFIYHVKLPIVGGVLANVRYKPTVKVFTNNTYPQYDLKNTIYYIDSSNNGLDIYFVAPRFLYGGSSYFYIMIENSVTTYFSAFRDITLEYISNANQNKEYYEFLDFMIQANMNDIENDTNSKIADLHDIYASPEEVQARNASQPVINEALDDFTGNGSASAKLNDVSSAKEVSNALRSGLDTGGTGSDVFNILKPASSFWGWFSNDNATYFSVLNNVPNVNNPSIDTSRDIYIDYSIPALFIDGVQYNLRPSTNNGRRLLKAYNENYTLIIDDPAIIDEYDRQYFDIIRGYNNGKSN